MPGDIKKDFQRNSAFSLYDIWPRPKTRSPTPGVIRLRLLVDSSLDIITTHLVCLNKARK